MKTQKIVLTFLAIFLLLSSCENLNLALDRTSTTPLASYVNIYNPFSQPVSVGAACGDGNYKPFVAPAGAYFCYSCSKGESKFVLGTQTLTARDGEIWRIAVNGNTLYFTR